MRALLTVIFAAASSRIMFLYTRWYFTEIDPKVRAWCQCKADEIERRLK